MTFADMRAVSCAVMDATEEALAVVRVRTWLLSGRARDIRKRAGLSQADVGRAIGTDGPQMSRWEAGKAVPYFDSALRLARFLDGLEEIMRDGQEAAAAGGRQAGHA